MAQMKTYIFKVVIEEDPFEDGRMAYHAFCPSLPVGNSRQIKLPEDIKNEYPNVGHHA